MNIDNQIDDDKTKYWCSIYALKNQIMLDYWIYIWEDKVITALEYFAKLGAFIPWFWADATIIYPVVIKYIKLKLWLSFEIVTRNIDTFNPHKWAILWFKRATKLYMQNIKDRELNQDEIDKLVDWKQVWHFHCYKRWMIIESLNWDYYNLSLDDLKYAFAKWLYYYNTRRFNPVWELTEKVCNRTLWVSKARQEAWFTKFPYVWLTELKEIIEEYK